MNIKKTIACLSVISVLAACGGPDSYYDSRGNFHETGANTDFHGRYDPKADPAINPSGDDNYYVDHSAVRGDPAKVSGYRRDLDPDVAPYYKQAGYYDRNGYYTAANAGPNIPRSYFPPLGLCRVWFLDRAPFDQPAVESCAGIQNRVPDNAYVVYGG